MDTRRNIYGGRGSISCCGADVGCRGGGLQQHGVLVGVGRLRRPGRHEQVLRRRLLVMTSMMMMMMVSVLLSLLLHRHQELRFNWYDKVKMRTIATLSAEDSSC